MQANGTSPRLKRTALLLLLCFSTASVVSAQTAASGGAPRQLSSAIAASVSEAGALEQATRVRRSDSVLNGALIGAGVAVATGLFLCTRTEPWENCRDDVGPILKIGALGAGIGIAIDALIQGRKTIYPAARGSRVYAAPVIDRRAKGVQLSVTF